MLPEILGLLLAASLSLAPSPARLWPVSPFSSLATFSSLSGWRSLSAAFGAAPTFRAADRTVSNWRLEAAAHLDLPFGSVLGVISGGDLAGVSRCVKLNNYWCIKRAGWGGEIAADGDGHVAFSAATEGATVAALLLRRYYLTYNRRSAMAIISRWAPAQCGGPAITGGGRRAPRSVSRATGAALAPRGLGNTLRARWLAAHGRGGLGQAGQTASIRRSVVRDHPLAMMRAPSIAVGMGEREVRLAPLKFASLGLGDAGRFTASTMLCSGDDNRIATYAQRAAEGVASGPDEDLKLFDATGEPSANLAKIMANMAKVEIGPLAARDDLIAAGIAQALRQIRDTQAAAAKLGAPELPPP